jgi:predicted RNase H-related nuclease YkuK (DUF458 family)
MKKHFDIEEVKQYISESSMQSKIYIGSDSFRYMKHGKWHAEYTVAVVVHKDGKHGCKVFGKTDVELDYDNKHNRPALRLMNEVYRASEMFLSLSDTIGDRHVEVHLDINPNVIHGSSCVVQQAIGYIRGVCNVVPMIKPEAFAASYAADRFKAFTTYSRAA